MLAWGAAQGHGDAATTAAKPTAITAIFMVEKKFDEL
jgi:hypothetical protein